VGKKEAGGAERGGGAGRGAPFLPSRSCPPSPSVPRIPPVMNSIFVHRDGRTEAVTSIDRSWHRVGSGVDLWVDLAAPSIPEFLVLTDSFAFHPLAVELARASRQVPTIDGYDGYFFAAIAGADADVSFFVSRQFIVSVHWEPSRAIADLIDSLQHGGKQFGEGPIALFHRLMHGIVGGFGALTREHTTRAGTLEKR